MEADRLAVQEEDLGTDYGEVFHTGLVFEVRKQATRIRCFHGGSQDLHSGS
jgi:hypothetical protein